MTILLHKNSVLSRKVSNKASSALFHSKRLFSISLSNIHPRLQGGNKYYYDKYGKAIVARYMDWDVEMMMMMTMMMQVQGPRHPEVRA